MRIAHQRITVLACACVLWLISGSADAQQQQRGTRAPRSKLLSLPQADTNEAPAPPSGTSTAAPDATSPPADPPTRETRDDRLQSRDSMRRRPEPDRATVPDGPLFPRRLPSAVRTGSRSNQYSTAPGGRVAGTVQSRFMPWPQVPGAQAYRGGIRRSTHYSSRR